VDLFPELGPVPARWEVWDSGSGSMILSTPDRGEALALAAEVWRLDGDGAIGLLSVACEPAGRVFRGRELRDLLVAEGLAAGDGAGVAAAPQFSNHRQIPRESTDFPSL